MTRTPFLVHPAEPIRAFTFLYLLSKIYIIFMARKAYIVVIDAIIVSSSVVII